MSNVAGDSSSREEDMSKLSPEEKQAIVKRSKTGASVALTVWWILFSLGLLVETTHHRYFLSPINVQQQLGVDGMTTFRNAYQTAERSRLEDVSTMYRTAHWLFALAISMFCFTPINLAALTFCSGLLGGYASNITFGSMTAEQLAEYENEHPTRMWCLQEPPMTAAIRGFVVYLCIIAGLYIALDDPFKTTTSAQYIRLAGLLSAISFLVGYDATRLDDWLRIIPVPTTKKSEDSSASNGANKNGLTKTPDASTNTSQE